MIDELANRLVHGELPVGSPMLGYLPVPVASLYSR